MRGRTFAFHLLFLLFFLFIRVVPACRNILCYRDTTDLKERSKTARAAADSASALLQFDSVLLQRESFHIPSFWDACFTSFTLASSTRQQNEPAAFFNSSFPFFTSFERHGKSQGVSLPSNGHAGCTPLGHLICFHISVYAGGSLKVRRSGH